MISYLDDHLWLDLKPETFGCVIYRNGASGPEVLSQFSKDELLKYQYILLNTYLYLYDLLEEKIECKASKNDLDYNKSLILTIRKILMIYTNYINDYDEMVKKFKEI
jgi:hypothetical protein